MADNAGAAGQPDRSGMSDVSGQPGVPDASGQPGMPEAADLSAPQAAIRLGVNERTIRRYIERGKLRARRIMTERGTDEYRIDVVDLDDFAGRRRALRHEDRAERTEAGQADRAGSLVLPAARQAEMSLSAVIASWSAQIDEYRAAIERLATEKGELAGELRVKDQLVEELRRRAELAESERADLARQLAEWQARVYDIGARHLEAQIQFVQGVREEREGQVEREQPVPDVFAGAREQQEQAQDDGALWVHLAQRGPTEDEETLRATVVGQEETGSAKPERRGLLARLFRRRAGRE